MTIKTQLNKDNPAFVNAAYGEMAEDWELCRDVRGGTKAIRADPEEYIIRSPNETDDGYKDRANRVEVFPAFRITVDGLTGIVFRKNPELQEDVPQLIQDHWENIDNGGMHGDVFAKQTFEEGLTDGHVGILVDYPPAPLGANGQPLTIAQEQALGLRPYWVMIKAEDIVSWRTRLVAGILTLSQVVIRESVEMPDGEFASSLVVRYKMFRLLDDNTIMWKSWDESSLNGWTAAMFNTPDSEGVLKGPKRIPLAIAYCGPRVAPMESKPPLLDLAHANVSHTNVLADHRYALHLASCPILVFKGRQKSRKADGTEEEQQIIGPDIGIDLPADSNADVFYVEHTGSALGQTRDELKDIEQRMAAMGLAMLTRETRAAETAEAKRMDKEEKQATLASAARSMQDAIEAALQFHAEYMGEASGGSCEVNKKFEDAGIDPSIAKLLSDMVLAGQLSLETMWRILKSRDILPQDMDDVKELARITSNQNLPVPGGASATLPGVKLDAQGNALPPNPTPPTGA